MPGRQDRLDEVDVGVRDARKNFANLIDKVDQERYIVHLTRDGKRVAALIGQGAAEQLKYSISEVLVTPGDIASAIRFVETCIVDDEGFAPDLEVRSIEELVGGVVFLLEMLLTCPALSGGELNTLDDKGKKTGAVELVADLILRRLYQWERIDRSVIPVIAGCLWAMQVRRNATEWRNEINLPLTAKEALAWVIALSELARLVNIIHGEGAAEELMYTVEELVRRHTGE